MCGRFTLTADMNMLQSTFPWMEMSAEFPPRYNIAPTQPVAVINNDGRYKLDYYHWGLIPSWAKDPSIGNRMINARAETITEKPSFRTAFHKRRCIILADGFFEWRKDNGKTPMYIKLEDKSPFAFAGLWDLWKAKDGSKIYSCTIITTQPNQVLMHIHDRMPVILSPEEAKDWINPQKQDTDLIYKLLKPYTATPMFAYPVSKMVNNPSIDVPECISPL